MIQTLQRVDFIQQEHTVFLSYAEASLSGNTNSISSVSSLVFGTYFIHGYNLWIRGEQSFLYLRTYSRHRDAYFAYGFGGNIDVVQKATVYLAVSWANDLIYLPKILIEMNIRKLKSVSFQIFTKSME